MKFFMWSVLLCMQFFTIVDAVAPKDFSFNRSVRSSSRLSEFNNPFGIYQPQIIDQTGIYYLVHDIAFDPTDDNQVCITIDADNVVLDLNLKTISQVSTSTQVGTIGILIKAGRENLVIRNGAMNGISGAGIKLEDGVQITDIFDLTILHMTGSGILLDGSATGTGITGLVLSNIAAQHMGNAEGTPVYGFVFNNASVINMENCACGNALTTTGNSYGISFNNCSSARIKSCIISNNMCGGIENIGVDIQDSDSLLFFDCISANHTTTSSDPTSVVAGFRLQNTTAIFFQGCTTTSLLGTYTTYGFYLNGCRYTHIDSSQSLANASINSSGYGFYSNNGTNNLFKSCEAMSNNGGDDAYGFALTGTEFVSSIEGCISEVNLASTGTGFGVFVGAGVSNCGITSNKILGNVGASDGFGVYDGAGAGTTNTYLSNIIGKNTTNINFISPSVPIFAGTLHDTPGPFENVTL